MLNLLQMFVSEGKMPIAGLIVILYVAFCRRLMRFACLRMQTESI